MPFGKNARIRLEHGGDNESTEHYETVTYWYGLPGAVAVKTDELDVGDAASEQRPRLRLARRVGAVRDRRRATSGASTRSDLDHRLLGEGREVYPAHTDTGRHTTRHVRVHAEARPATTSACCSAASSITRFPNQRAEVFVAADADAATPDWKPAGVWYLAGSNTCVYSNPNGRARRDAAQRSRRRTAASATTSS